MVLADLRDSLDLHGVQSAHLYLTAKLAEGGAVRQLLDASPAFRALRGGLEAAARAGADNPKMQRLVAVLREHFSNGGGSEGGAQQQEQEEEEEGSCGRVIVFTNLRESVAGIVAALSQHEPLITARAFIGQGGGSGKGSKGKGSSGKGGSSGSSSGGGGPGMTQKEQKEVLAGFRAGAFNVLVATSIGEEGLDIPQVSRGAR